ncbi:MAG: sulfotransferase family protein [Shewanella sp.]
MDNNQSFHFISGLPRSGSTLLAALLRQNPRFYAGMSSPVGGFFNGLLNQFSAGSEYGSVITQTQRRRLLKGLFESYYADEKDKDIIFDTNRIWPAKLPALMDLYPQAKVIACVRNVAWVMDSIEKIYRANPFENTKLYNDDIERNTVYSRVDTLAQRNRLVGFAWAALKDAYYGQHAKSMLLIEYDLLAETPEKVMQLVYEFIGEPWYEHDFNNVQYDAPEFDLALGLDGLHRVRSKVAAQHRNTILPPDLFNQYNSLSFWNDEPFSEANVIRIKKSLPVT